MPEAAASVKKFSPYVVQHPLKAGRADAVLAGTGVPVWAIVAHWRLVGDVATVALDYLVPVKAVEGALAYYRKNQAVIDARIEANYTD